MSDREFFSALIDLLVEHYEIVGRDPDEAAMDRIRRFAATPTDDHVLALSSRSVA
jgi:hypothetical protein